MAHMLGFANIYYSNCRAQPIVFGPVGIQVNRCNTEILKLFKSWTFSSQRRQRCHHWKSSFGHSAKACFPLTHTETRSLFLHIRAPIYQFHFIYFYFILFFSVLFVVVIVVCCRSVLAPIANQTVAINIKVRKRHTFFFLFLLCFNFISLMRIACRTFGFQCAMRWRQNQWEKEKLFTKIRKAAEIKNCKK